MLKESRQRIHQSMRMSKLVVEKCSSSRGNWLIQKIPDVGRSLTQGPTGFDPRTRRRPRSGCACHCWKQTDHRSICSSVAATLKRPTQVLKLVDNYNARLKQQARAAQFDGPTGFGFELKRHRLMVLIAGKKRESKSFCGW